MSATHGDRDSVMRYESSAGELSSPPSGSLSEPESPSRHAAAAARFKNMNSGDISMSDDQRHEQGSALQYEQMKTVPGSENGPPKRFGMVDGVWVQLTAAGVPRKKPGRKPGTVVKTKNADGSEQQPGQLGQEDQPRVRKPRKPKDPNAPPVQRKRKIAPADAASESNAPSAKVVALGHDSARSPPQSISNTPAHPHQSTSEHRFSPSVSKREVSTPAFMQSILNAETPSRIPSNSNGNTIPVRTVGQSYDPIRDGKYDPVRETMVANPYSSNAGSPRAPTQASNRSPSIASMIEPHAPPLRSPSSAHIVYPPTSTQPRFQTSDSLPVSPSNLSRPMSTPAQTSLKKDLPPAPPPIPRPVPKESNFTTIANGPVRKTSPKHKSHTGVSTPKTDNLDDTAQEGEGRSILDFGRAKPGEVAQTPTILLDIPIHPGETNKYVNFMRLAEERYGWDALHPRLAANRDRKARIAAATASLKMVDAGRDSGDEMSVDLSDVEGSNLDNGATTDAQIPKKKKRNLKMDNYDVDDDFVDDSELLWEAQAAASRDGFFVYSGPLVQEVEKPPAGQDEPPKRGRGGGGRGSRGGRGASTRGGTGTGRGGGPGSRGGAATRKPRITKSEKAQREREKAERETMAQNSALQPTTPSFAVRELGA